MGTVVPVELCPVLVSCQAFSGVLVIFLISNGELPCCPSIQIILNRRQWCLYFLITILWHTKCFARNGGISWQRSRLCAFGDHLSAEAVEDSTGCKPCSGWDCSRMGCGTAHLQEVCLQSHLPRINTLSQWGLRRHRGDTYTCSENLEKITTCVFSKEFPSGLCTHLVGGWIVSCWTLFRGVCGLLLFFYQLQDT